MSAPHLTHKPLGEASMSQIIYHNHHIIPRHAGGTDDPKNMVRLTVPEHAEAHRLLYEQYGRKQDYVAWKATAGIIGREEITKELQSLPRSEETRKKMSEAKLGKKRIPRTKEHCQNQSEAMERYWTAEMKQKQSAGMTGKKRGPYKKKSLKQLSLPS